MRAVLGIGMILLALVLAIAPAYTDCESHGKTLKTADGRAVSMKCHWTGRAEVATAIPLGLAGIFALGGRRREATRFAATVGGASGLAAILLPTLLIGTCGSASMTCNLLMRPIVLAAGILAIAASIALFITAREPELPVSRGSV